MDRPTFSEIPWRVTSQVSSELGYLEGQQYHWILTKTVPYCEYCVFVKPEIQ